MDRTLDDLEHIRAGLLEAFDSAGDGVKAQIASQLRQVVLDLEKLRQGQGPSIIDELRQQGRVRRGEAGTDQRTR